MNTTLLMVALLYPTAEPDLSAVLNKLQAHQTVQASMVQLKTNKAFKQPQRSEGRFIVAPPRKLRWEYQKPFRTTLVLNGDKVSMSYPDLNRKQTFDLNRDPSMKAVLETILFFLEAKPARVNERFSVTLAAAETDVARLTLVPKAETARQLLARIVVDVDTQRGVLARIQLIEPDGDSSDIRFSKHRLNEAVDEALLTP